MSEIDVARATELVLRYGWNATAFQVVNPGIRHWYPAKGDGLIGYVRRNRVLVVAGSPVCALGRLESTVREFESAAASRGDSVCYFGAAGRLRALVSNRPDYATVVLGAQPVWCPDHWEGIVEGVSSLRAQLNRARNKGVAVREWSTEQAHSSPELRRCLDEWLRTRGLPPLHFLVEPETLERLSHRRVFVAERDGRAVGFLVASPVPMRRGWLTEQFPRGKDAPNGTVELLMDAAVRAMAANGAEYVTMGLVPLSNHGRPPRFDNPLWLRIALGWIRAHGRRFYDFDGLDRFKSKFRPERWEPIYAISNEPRFSFRSLYAIASAFCDGPPLTAVLHGAAKAVRQEARWVGGR